MNYYTTHTDLVSLLSEAVNIGFQKGLEIAGLADAMLSQRQAARMLGGRVRLKSLVDAGVIKNYPAGTGKSGTIYYKRTDIMTAVAARSIVVGRTPTAEDEAKVNKPNNK